MEKKPTITEIEELLDQEEDEAVEILPNGEVRTPKTTERGELGGKKPLTFREDLGGEYGGPTG